MDLDAARAGDPVNRQVVAEVVAALETAAVRIEAFHTRQLPQDLDYVDDDGIGLGQRWRPIAAAGLYVPGGRAAYPSSLLMNAIPARVAWKKASPQSGVQERKRCY